MEASRQASSSSSPKNNRADADQNQRRGGVGGVGGVGVAAGPVPQVPSLLGQMNRLQVASQPHQHASLVHQAARMGVDRVKEYPWQSKQHQQHTSENNGSHNMLHQQSMEWLRLPRGFYGLSDGPLEGLKRLRRELMVEYQQLGGGDLIQQQRLLKEREAANGGGGGGGGGRGGRHNVFNNREIPPQWGQQRYAPHAHGSSFGYKPDQLDQWISDFQHKKLGQHMKHHNRCV